jgi:hypothetical protein
VDYDVKAEDLLATIRAKIRSSRESKSLTASLTVKSGWVVELLPDNSTKEESLQGRTYPGAIRRLSLSLSVQSVAMSASGLHRYDESLQNV